MSALCWAFGAIVTKRFRAEHDVELLPFTAWQMAYGAVPITVVALLVISANGRQQAALSDLQAKYELQQSLIRQAEAELSAREPGRGRGPG